MKISYKQVEECIKNLNSKNAEMKAIIDDLISYKKTISETSWIGESSMYYCTQYNTLLASFEQIYDSIVTCTGNMQASVNNYKALDLAIANMSVTSSASKGNDRRKEKVEMR